MDLFISRGAWLNSPIRQSLLRNNGNGTFSDVTEEAGLLDPVNSTYSCWADYDNDGWLDVYIICEQQTNRLYHNRGNGTFEEVSPAPASRGTPSIIARAQLDRLRQRRFSRSVRRQHEGTAKLYHNNRNGTFSDVTESMGIDGPQIGFSCWAWDYDNDGWLDIFATSFDYSVGDVVNGMTGQPHKRLIKPALAQRRGARNSRTGRPRPGSTWCSRRWDATSATSTTTAGSTFIWEPARPT